MGFVDDRGRPTELRVESEESVSAREYRVLNPMLSREDPAYERTPREVRQATVRRAWGVAGSVVTVLFVVATVWSAVAAVRKGLSGGGWDLPCFFVVAVVSVVILVLQRFSRAGVEDRAREGYFLAARAARIGRCPGCGYRLEGVLEDADGCRVCPECGGAWDLGAWRRDWAVLEQAHESTDRNSRRWPTPGNIRVVAVVGSRPLGADRGVDEVGRVVARGECPCCAGELRKAGHGRPWVVCGSCRCVCWAGERLKA